MAGDKVFASTETDALRMEAIAEFAQRELIASAVVAPNVFDVSQFAVPGAKSIEFPRAGSFSVQRVASEEEESQAQTVTYATDKLDLDVQADIDWIIPKRSQLQSLLNLEQELAAGAARAHAADLDKNLIEHMEAGIASGDNVSISSNLALGDIAEGLRKLVAKNYPQNDITFVGSPELYEDMLGFSQVNAADTAGETAGLRQGSISPIYGVRFVFSSQVEAVTGTARSGFMFHRESVALGMQQAPDFESQPDLKARGTRYSLDQLYGIKVLQGGAGAADVGVIKFTT